MKTPLIALVLLSLLPARSAEVLKTSSFTDPKTGVTIVRGEIQLPADDVWGVMPEGTNACVTQVMTTPPETVVNSLKGSRYQRAENARALRSGENNLRSIYWSLRRHAELHNGIGPANWTELSDSMWQHLKSVTNDFYLVANTPILDPEQRLLPSASILAVELNPALDDGQHWVLLTDSQCLRRRIDPEFIARHGLVIRAGKNPELTPAAAKGVTVAWTLHALLRPDAGTSATLLLRNRKGTTIQATWDVSQPQPGNPDIFKTWDKQREGAWAYMAQQAGDFGVFKAWLSLRQKPADENRRGRAEDTDIFGVLGGRAALRETLQMQAIAMRSGVSNATDTVALSEIPGVEVKAHPFEEMLKGAAGGSLPLAELSPPDRLFVNFMKPKAILPMLGEGNDFLFRMALPVAGNNINYALKQRYLARMGMSEDWLRLALESGAVSDVALLLPDLFLIDGTDVTVLARLSSATAFLPLLKAAGAGDLTSGIASVPLKSGKTAHWAMSGDVLVAGSNRGEVEAVLALAAAKGQGSLGRSAEFRYMLTQLPVGANTRALAYVSDPFIRNLVGPRAKIGQLRRLSARRDLEIITCAALLHRADGQPGAPDLAALVAKGYLPAALARADYSLRPDLTAVSAQYGTLAHPRSLREAPFEKVTRREADAYGQYLENYNRFWRQFFDPIAMRLDDEPNAGLSLTTFVLPLLDSTIYNGLKEYVATREDGVALAVPESLPHPVVQLSLNLKEQAWQGVAEGMADDFGRRIHLDPAIFDELGPAAHFAVLDGDPVLALGSSDLLGAFGGSLARMRGSEMVMIPMVASILTRPCVMMVQLRNPEVVVRALDNASIAPFGEENFADLSFNYYKIEGRDRWVCSIDLFGVARMRLGIEVREGLLLLDNLPWSPWPEELNVRAAPLNGVVLTVRPEAAQKQLAALFTSAMETERVAAMQGIARLHPLLLAGETDVKEALERHAAWFGFAPKHPGRGEWTWKDGLLSSSTFGHFGKQVQPAHEKGSRAFGVFSDVDELNVNLQFEDTGLRVRAEWR